MVSTEITFSTVALIISGIAVFYTYRSVKEQREASRSTAAYTYLAAAETLLEKYPELFELHNIDPKLSDECDVTPPELLYLMQSFVSSDLYHRLGKDRTVTLTDYRKNLLTNEKVQKVWKLIIRDNLLSPSPFSKKVDSFIKEQAKKLM